MPDDVQITDPIVQLADDGCPHAAPDPHASDPTADPAVFARIAEGKDRVFVMFVHFRPAALQAVLGKEYAGLTIDSGCHGGHHGSFVSTEDVTVFKALYTRFYRDQENFSG